MHPEALPQPVPEHGRIHQNRFRPSVERHEHPDQTVEHDRHHLQIPTRGELLTEPELGVTVAATGLERGVKV